LSGRPSVWLCGCFLFSFVAVVCVAGTGVDCLVIVYVAASSCCLGVDVMWCCPVMLAAIALLRVVISAAPSC
jgi:hypothetical protein